MKAKKEQPATLRRSLKRSREETEVWKKRALECVRLFSMNLIRHGYTPMEAIKAIDDLDMLGADWEITIKRKT